MIPPSAASVKVHGMGSLDPAGSPTDADARETLRLALDECFILSWYAPVEIAFLGRMFEGGRRRFRRRTIDVRELAIGINQRRRHGFEAAEYSLSACASRYGVPVASPHDALDDALVTAQVFLVLAAGLERGGVRSRRCTAARRANVGVPSSRAPTTHRACPLLPSWESGFLDERRKVPGRRAGDPAVAFPQR